jgi:hypothetical protein
MMLTLLANSGATRVPHGPDRRCARRDRRRRSAETVVTAAVHAGTSVAARGRDRRCGRRVHRGRPGTGAAAPAAVPTRKPPHPAAKPAVRCPRCVVEYHGVAVSGPWHAVSSGRVRRDRRRGAT